jgi:Glycosyltransferase family 87
MLGHPDRPHDSSSIAQQFGVCMTNVEIGQGVESNRKAAVSRLGIVFLLIFAGFTASHSKLMRENVGNRDSIQYWATGHLLVEHQNPYDPGAVERLEGSQGQVGAMRPLMFRVPPWGLVLLAPLGLLDPFWAWFVWFSCSVAAVVLSVRACLELFGAKGDVASNCALAAYLFAPVLACIEAGQIGAFLLLGIVLFLRWEQKWPFLAGAALILPFAKPHLFLLFGVACGLWIIFRRRWVTLAGFSASLILSVVVALLFDPAAFVHYRGMLAQQAIWAEFIPSLAGVFRLVVAHGLFWVQFLPSLVGAGWTVWFWTRHRVEWDWRQHGLRVLLVSVLVSPYAWLPDEIVLLPVIYQAAVWLFGSRASRKRAALVGTLMALNALLLVMAVVQVPLPSGAYVWSGLVWIGWYALGRKSIGQAGVADGSRQTHEIFAPMSSVS